MKWSLPILMLFLLSQSFSAAAGEDTLVHHLSGLAGGEQWFLKEITLPTDGGLPGLGNPARVVFQGTTDREILPLLERILDSQWQGMAVGLTDEVTLSISPDRDKDGNDLMNLHAEVILGRTPTVVTGPAPGDPQSRTPPAGQRPAWLEPLRHLLKRARFVKGFNRRTGKTEGVGLWFYELRISGFMHGDIELNVMGTAFSDGSINALLGNLRESPLFRNVTVPPRHMVHSGGFDVDLFHFTLKAGLARTAP